MKKAWPIVIAACASVLGLALVLAWPGPASSCNLTKAGSACVLTNPLPAKAAADGGYVPEWTEAHMHGLNGIGAVVQYFQEMEKWVPEATDVWQEACDWMVAHAQPGNPGVKWETWEELRGWENIFGHPTTGWNAMALAEGYARCGNRTYLNAALGGMEWLVSEIIPIDSLMAGEEGCLFIEMYDQLPTQHIFNNSTYGQAAIGQGGLGTWRFTGDSNALTIAECIAQALMAVSVPDGASGGIKWPFTDPVFPTGIFHLGRCAGAAGIIEFFLEMVKSFPDSTQYVDQARGGLDWIASLAVPVPEAVNQPAYKWPSKELPEPQKYLEVIGGGAAGIGRVFLMGHEVFGDQVYLDNAIAAGNWLLHVAEAGPEPEMLYWHDSGFPDFNTMHCRGESGIMDFFAHLYEASGDDLHGTAAAKAALWILHWVQRTRYGPMYPFEPGGDFVNIDFWWSSHAIANPFYNELTQVAELWPLRDVYILPMNFLFNCKIVEDGGYTWNIQEPFWPGLDDSPLPHEHAASPPARSLATSWPNPAREEVTVRTVYDPASRRAKAGGPPPAGQCELRVYDLAGRLVITLRSADGGWEKITDETGESVASSGASELLWRWEGHDGQGRRVPEGVYLAQLHDGAKPVGDTVRIVMVR